MRYKCLIYTLLPLLIPATVLSTEVADDQWFDEADDLQARVARVNGGDLVFLAEPPLDPVHHHRWLLSHDESPPQTSRKPTSLALRWMKPRRPSTSSPMRTEKISSAAAASSRVTWSSTRESGFIVVSHSSW